MSKVQSKSRASKVSSPTRPPSKKSKSGSVASSFPKLLISVRHTKRAAEGGEEEEGEGQEDVEEIVTYIILADREMEQKTRKKSRKSEGGILSMIHNEGESNLTRKKSRKSEAGIFMTQDEGEIIFRVHEKKVANYNNLSEMESTHATLATENLVLAGGTFTQWKHR